AEHEADPNRRGDHDHAVEQKRPEVVVAHEPVIVVEADLLRPQLDARKNIDRPFERRDDHPPEGENGEEHRDGECQINERRAEPFAASHSINSDLRRMKCTAAIIKISRHASSEISIAIARPYW